MIKSCNVTRKGVANEMNANTVQAMGSIAQAVAAVLTLGAMVWGAAKHAMQEVIF